MKKTQLLAALLLVATSQIFSQSTAYVLKTGMSIGTQRWDNSFERQSLLKPHFALAIESVNNEDDRGSVFAQFGYHTRGSATRFRFLFTGGGQQTLSQQFTFSNFALILAAKSKKPLAENARYFYYGGLRGEYTWKTNIDELSQPNSQTFIYYPQIGGVQRWVGGLSVGGGVEYDLRELVGVQVEFSVHPDITLQYRQPAVGNVIDPNNPGQTITIPERRIRNLSLELTVGLRLLRKVIYED